MVTKYGHLIHALLINNLQTCSIGARAVGMTKSSVAVRGADPEAMYRIILYDQFARTTKIALKKGN